VILKRNGPNESKIRLLVLQDRGSWGRLSVASTARRRDTRGMCGRWRRGRVPAERPGSVLGSSPAISGGVRETDWRTGRRAHGSRPVRMPRGSSRTCSDDPPAPVGRGARRTTSAAPGSTVRADSRPDHRMTRARKAAHHVVAYPTPLGTVPTLARDMVAVTSFTGPPPRAATLPASNIPFSGQSHTARS